MSLSHGKQRGAPRITIVNKLYHQPKNSSPVMHERRYVRHINSVEEPVIIKGVARPHKNPIDQISETDPKSAIDFQSISFIKIQNDVGTWLEKVIPPQEKIENDRQRIIVVLVNDVPFCKIHPGEELEIPSPIDYKSISFQCLLTNDVDGKEYHVPYTVILFPA